MGEDDVVSTSEKAPFEEADPETISTVAELMDIEESLRLQDSPAGAAVGPPSRWAFRGQPGEYKKLTPSFQRVFPPSSSSFGAAELIEKELMTAFRQHYASLPDLSSDMPRPAAIGHGYDLRCLSVMQHYEVPTRLLDWTSDFWTAVYFACSSDPDSDAELWFYDRHIFDPQLARSAALDLRSLLLPSMSPPPEPELLQMRNPTMLVELDPGLTTRMKQQFAHHTISTNLFADHALGLWDLALEYQPQQGRGVFSRHVITASCKGKALQFLAQHKGVTASSVFPDFAGLGRFLRWQLDSLRTMLL